jgi:starch phosphorylase
VSATGTEAPPALAAVLSSTDLRFRAAAIVSVAWAVTRAGNVFTTHTPVEAGFDRFAPKLVSAHLGA